MSEFIKETNIGKTIKAGLATIVGAVILSGALNFVEKNYQINNIDSPTQIHFNLDSNDNNTISDIISLKINKDNVQKYIDNAKDFGIDEKAIFVDVENDDQIKELKEKINIKYKDEPNKKELLLKSLNSAIENTKLMDSPFQASNVGEYNFFTVKSSSNYVLDNIMDSIQKDFGNNTVSNVMEAMGNHEIQHMITHNAITKITKALAMGEITKDKIDSIEGSEYIEPGLKEKLKNLTFSEKITQEDFDLYNKINKSQKAESKTEADKFYKTMNNMKVNMLQVADLLKDHQKTDQYVLHEEMLSDTYGALLAIKDGKTDVAKAVSQMRLQGLEKFNDTTHDTHKVMDFLNDNIKPEMLKNMSVKDISELATKIVDGVGYGNDMEMKKEMSSLNLHAHNPTDIKFNEITTIQPSLSFLTKFRNGSYDSNTNTIKLR